MENTATTSTAADASTDDLTNRLRKLKMMQHEYVSVEKNYHHRFFELDMEYQKRRQEVYDQRKLIINGTDDKHHVDKGVKGIPEFWLRALKNCTPNLICDCDEAALKYLSDIKLHLFTVPELSFILEFEFAANPFFENATLTKQYFLDCDADEEFHGFSIVRTIGCGIQWKPGMDVIAKDENSFFKFFNPPDVNISAYDDEPMQSNEMQQPDIFNEFQHDVEIGLMIKEKLIPNAILYYLGELEEIIECTLYDCDETSVL